MPIPLPRDPDGYIDLDAFPDDEVDLDLAALAPVPALPEDTWDEIVGAAPHTDPEALGFEVDDVLVAPMETPGAGDSWDGDLGADDDIRAAEVDSLQDDAGGFELDDPAVGDD